MRLGKCLCIGNLRIMFIWVNIVFLFVYNIVSKKNVKIEKCY